ncbi:hypothetical protein SLEP1_g14269 [Rubroshorea leprosula]|uniref:Uncharacterized protein n=1 Tax=Rubroshorea leprosula TaxID=152421 RepID=A0AAV5IU26_9ROSI|nr:hypothetical protein SLEP1_g14269 [Rubroshorea leprosula]
MGGAFEELEWKMMKRKVDVVPTKLEQVRKNKNLKNCVNS